MIGYTLLTIYSSIDIGVRARGGAGVGLPPSFFELILKK